MQPPDPADPTRTLSTLGIAAGLALAAAVSLGLARFSYALLLPPMLSDLGWSYFTAGAMNTLNAAGYFVGALLAPRWIARYEPRPVLLAGGFGSALLLAGHGLVSGEAALLALRMLTGVASAATFVSGGLLAARLSARGPVAGGDRPGPSSGLVLGIYYGGTGIGIVLAALVVPPLVTLPTAHAWQRAWTALGGAAFVATLLTALATRHLDPQAATAAQATMSFARRRFAFGLMSYFLFGLGYIGYMTFVVTLLREEGLSRATVVTFYLLLGFAVVGSSFAWAGLLQRHRGGGAMRLLNGLLALATVLPVVSTQPAVVFVSGLLFGGVFLSVVASTTALVRHNAPPGAWSGGIGAFTVVFAAGQIIGPALVGWLADGGGGLRGGLVCSAAVLLAGAVLAGWQRPVDFAAA